MRGVLAIDVCDGDAGTMQPNETKQKRKRTKTMCFEWESIYGTHFVQPGCATAKLDENGILLARTRHGFVTHVRIKKSKIY